LPHDLVHSPEIVLVRSRYYNSAFMDKGSIAIDKRVILYINKNRDIIVNCWILTWAWVDIDVRCQVPRWLKIDETSPGYPTPFGWKILFSEGRVAQGNATHANGCCPPFCFPLLNHLVYYAVENKNPKFTSVIWIFLGRGGQEISNLRPPVLSQNLGAKHGSTTLRPRTSYLFSFLWVGFTALSVSVASNLPSSHNIFVLMTEAKTSLEPFGSVLFPQSIG